MKKYIVKLLVFALLVATPFAGYFAYVQSLPPQFTPSLTGSLHHKLDILEKTADIENRLIVLGGSSAPYAFIGEDITAATGKKTINVGVTAYLGLDYYLSMMDNYAQSGDTVLLALEHMLLTDNSTHHSTVWTAIENDSRALKILPVKYYPDMLLRFYQYSRDKLDIFKTSPVQDSSYFNGMGEFGDITIYRETLLESGYNKLDLIHLNEEYLNQEVIKALNAFHLRMEKRNVKVYFTFASLNKMAVTSTSKDNEAFENALKANITIPFISTLSASLMDGKYFYDSNNHLTSEGAKIYTDNFITAFNSISSD